MKNILKSILISLILLTSCINSNNTIVNLNCCKDTCNCPPPPPHVYHHRDHFKERSTGCPIDENKLFCITFGVCLIIGGFVLYEREKKKL